MTTIIAVIVPCRAGRAQHTEVDLKAAASGGAARGSRGDGRTAAARATQVVPDLWAGDQVA
jgi:hypothetical protein